GYWVEFTNPPSAEVLSQLRQLPTPVRVRSGAPASMAEISAVKARLSDPVAASPAIEQSSVIYDHERRVLEFTLVRADNATTTQVQEVVNEAYRAALLPSSDELPLPIELSEVADLG